MEILIVIDPEHKGEYKGTKTKNVIGEFIKDVIDGAMYQVTGELPDLFMHCYEAGLNGVEITNVMLKKE